MTTYHLIKRTAAGLLGGSLLPLIGASPALATGVPAGTLIANTATATYNAGGAPGSVTSNTVTIKVDELLNVAVATLSTSPTSAGAAPATLVYSVTNGGNGPEAFNLAADPNIAGNGFNGTITGIAIDTNGNGTYEAGVDALLGAAPATPALSPDGSVKVFVLVSVPAGATDAQTSQVRLTATATTGSGTPGTSFAGQGEGGGNAVVGLSTASSNSLAALIASLASVTLTKSATISDQFGSANPVPGATVVYSLAAKVTGSGTAHAVGVADAIPVGTTYVPGSLKLDGAGLTDASDSDTGTADASGIAVGLGDVAGGTTRTVNFSVKIN
jgi:uncharacterized repeat protein (TIGR01451 family)